jgi:hypothetical protein
MGKTDNAYSETPGNSILQNDRLQEKIWPVFQPRGILEKNNP